MDDFIEKYQNLKISAFNKVKQVNSSIHNVTIGPDSSFEDYSDVEPKENTKNLTKHEILKRPIRRNHPVSDLRQLLLLKEMQRKEQVQDAIKNHQKKITEGQQIQYNQRKDIWVVKQRELLFKVEQQELQIFKVLEEYDKNSNRQNEQKQQYYQHLEEQRKKRDQEMQAKEQMKRNLQFIDKITRNQQQIALIYHDIIEILKSNVIGENIKKPITEISQQLKSLNLEIEGITRKSKINVTMNEVERSSVLVEQILSLKSQIQRVIDEYNKQQENAKKQEQVKEIKETLNSDMSVTISGSMESNPKHENATNKIEKFVSKRSFRYYSELQDFLQKYEKSYENLLATDNLKQFIFDCKKAVNIPVNAISAISPQHLLDKYNKLSNLLSGKPVLLGDSQITATKHPQGIAFCMDLLAKKFVLQGDLMISSKPEAAYCYATIILSLWIDFPNFGKLLLAHFHKQCPYLVPIHLPKIVGQSDEEYYRNLGYQYDDGVVEKQDKFLKRMTGIMKLYSAIMIATPKKSHKGNHPHDLSQGWRWLTATLNLEPKTDITATLLYVFLETTGFMMQNIYNKEFKKIILFIMNVYMPMLQKIDSAGPYARLEVLLQEYQQKGCFSQPEGILSYW